MDTRYQHPRLPRHARRAIKRWCDANRLPADGRGILIPPPRQSGRAPAGVRAEVTPRAVEGKRPGLGVGDQPLAGGPDPVRLGAGPEQRMTGTLGELVL